MRFRPILCCLSLAMMPGLAICDDDGPVSALDVTLVADASNVRIEPPQESIAIDAVETEGVAIAIAEETKPAATQKEETPDSNFWIGLDCSAPDETLRAQLGLKTPQGLVIREVFDASPAAASGLKVHDVITSVKFGSADHKITGTPQLAELIQTSNGQPITIAVLRGGKSQELTVTPAQRPVIEQARHEAGPPRRLPRGRGRGDGDRPGRRPGPGFGHGPHGRFGGPMMAKLGAEWGKLPDDMKITITKSGNQPADISITQGEKSWTVKDGDVKTLPAEVRGSLAKFLGFGLMSKLRDAFADGMPPAAGPGQRPHRGPGAAQHHRRDRRQDRHAHGGRRHHRQHAHHGRSAPHRSHGRHDRLAKHERGGPHHAGHGSKHGHHDCPICQMHQRHAHGPQPGMGHPHHPPMSRPGTPDLGGKLEMLVGRLERVLGAPHGGPFAGGQMFGGGGFPRAHAGGGPGAMSGRPQSEGPARPGAPNPAPWAARRPHQEGASERRHDDRPAEEDLRDQLHRMQEQQERMARALRDLSEALERTQRK